MNTRIFNLIIKNLEIAFSLPKYDNVRTTLSKDTRVDFLPWTPARHSKFEEVIKKELDFDSIELVGTVEEIVRVLDERYLGRFFGEIWKPRTESFSYSGWGLVEEINKHNPTAVLDFGCGYNQFKGRINNLIGIDPYNNCADYMVDILDFKVPNESYDAIMALGSLNFNSEDEILLRFKRIVELLKTGGRIYIRANPGLLHKNGPYVDIFPWTFEVAYELAQKYNLDLETFKKDNNDRLYFVYLKK
jgi:SAM-dependent methyltransferase